MPRSGRSAALRGSLEGSAAGEVAPEGQRGAENDGAIGGEGEGGGTAAPGDAVMENDLLPCFSFVRFLASSFLWGNFSISLVSVCWCFGSGMIATYDRTQATDENTGAAVQ